MTPADWTVFSAGGCAPAQPAGSLPITPVPARTLCRPHSIPQGVLETQSPAGQLHQMPQLVQRVAQPAAGSLSAKPGAPAAGQVVEWQPSTLQQQQQAHVEGCSLNAMNLYPECSAGPSSVTSAGQAAAVPLQGLQQALVRTSEGGGLIDSPSQCHNFWLSCWQGHPKLLMCPPTPSTCGACRCLSPWIRCCCSGMGGSQ